MTRRRIVRERKRLNKADRALRALIGAYAGRPARRSLARFFWAVDSNSGYAKMYFPLTEAPHADR